MLTIFMLPAAALILAAAAIMILATGGRPAFVGQMRVGLRGRTFFVYGLRALPVGSSLRLLAGDCDAQETAVERALRQLQVDSLLQLYNVLKGDMSLIGPRAELPHRVAANRRSTPGFEERHLARPGLTGLAQLRADFAPDMMEARRKLGYDLFYVRRNSFGLDAYIAARTIVAIIRGSGVCY